MEDRKTPFTQAIWQITDKLHEAQSLDNALAASLEIIIDTLNSEAGSIWLLDKGSDRLYPVFNQGPVDISGITIENGQGIAGSVVQSGKSIITSVDAEDSRFTSSVDEESGFLTKTLICVPLKDSHETIGCIEILNRKDGGVYDEEDLMLCEAVASLTAVAIEGKGLFFEPSAQQEVIISLRGVTKDYPSGDGVAHVLRGINLDVYKNEFLVVLGESGCGKSTLVNIIGGMDFLTDGQLLINGKDFSRPTNKDLTQFRRDYLGFVFQSYNLMPNLTALENVQFIADIAQNPMSAEEAIAKVGLTDRAGNYPSALSGGQQQRVAIARAVVKRPQIIFADEPTAALDYETSIEVLSVFEEIKKEVGTTIMMITHNPEIAKMADRVIKMRDGRVSSIKVNLHPLSAGELSW
ncbi:MAG: ATP-binding cassette domain-containing protein [Oscillospiraceae bacterium]|nr:ATP-binding cassette domain-containing protein [Oscillospiraceae bacterium]